MAVMHRVLIVVIALLLATPAAWGQFGGSKILEKAKSHAQEKAQEASDRDPAEEARKADQKRQAEEARRAEAERQRKAAEAEAARQKAAAEAKAKADAKPEATPGDAPASATPEPISLRMSPTEYPRVDGSSTTAALGQLVAAKIIGMELAPERDPRTGGYRFTNRDDASTFNARLSHDGTHPAYEQLIGGIASLVLTSRKPSADELSLAEKLDVQLEVRPVAVDALGLIVHEGNPVRSLTAEQLRGIFSGTITRWQEVGGADVPIRILGRERSAGSHEMLTALVMGDQRPATPSTTAATTAAVREAVAKDPAAVACITFGQEAHALSGAGMRLLAIDGIAPTAATLTDRSYPLASLVYVVTRQPSPSEQAAKLRDWLLSKQGQGVVAECGYAPVE